MTLSKNQYLEHFRRDADALADLVAVSDVHSAVPSCPGWNVRDLVIHLGSVHRWAEHAVRTAEKPPRSMWEGAPEDAEGEQLAGWYRHVASELLATMQASEPTAPTWHLFPTEMVVSLWYRRQTQETMVHVWDARNALGAPAPLDAALASDGIDEYFDYMVPRMLMRDDVAAPSADLHVHCTDVEGEWHVRTEALADGGSKLILVRAHVKADAALRGRAEDLLLTLWGRTPTQPIDVVGSAEAAAAWLAIGGV